MLSNSSRTWRVCHSSPRWNTGTRTSPRSTAATRSSTDSVLASGRRTSSIGWAVMCALDLTSEHRAARTCACGAVQCPDQAPSHWALQAWAAAGAVVGDRAIAGVGGVRRLQDILVVDDIVESPARLRAVLRR